MSLITNLFELFCGQSFFLLEKEDHEIYSASVTVKSIEIPEEHRVSSIIHSFPDLDSVTIDINATSALVNINNKKEIGTSLEDLKDVLSEIEPDGDIEVKITVSKNVLGSAVLTNIYSLSAFSDYLNTLDLQTKLGVFSKLFKGNNLVFRLLNPDDLEAHSQSIFFVSDPQKMSSTEFKRSEMLDRIKKETHFSNGDKYLFTPEDFILTSTKPEFPLNDLFQKLSQVFLLIAVCDITEIQENDIHLKLNGYKSLSGKINFNSINISSLQEYYKIYEWAYEGGNLADKLGLCRNIISIHVNPSTFEVEGEVYRSVKSGFEIYLKQNIKQYIEVRNKVFDQLSDLSKRANDIGEKYISTFQKSVFGFVSFFISVIIVRFLSAKEFQSLLSREARFLSLAFLAATVLFLIFSLVEVNLAIKRFITIYNNTKVRYKDLLDESDINKMLNNDNDFNEDLRYIKSRRNWSTGLWISVIIIFGMAVLILSE